MSVSRKSFAQVLDRIADEYDMTTADLWGKIGDLVTPTSPFASRSAKELAEEKGIDITKIKGSGNLKKITSDDIRLALGEPVKNKTPTEWSSKQSEKLAKEHNLKASDFPGNKRTGRKWKNAKHPTISIADVKLKCGLSTPKKKSLYASTAAKTLAKENNLKAKDLTGSGKAGKITKKDIEKYIKDSKVEDSESEDNNSESEDESKEPTVAEDNDEENNSEHNDEESEEEEEDSEEEEESEEEV